MICTSKAFCVKSWIERLSMVDVTPEFVKAYLESSDLETWDIMDSFD